MWHLTWNLKEGKWLGIRKAKKMILGRGKKKCKVSRNRKEATVAVYEIEGRGTVWGG